MPLGPNEALTCPWGRDLLRGASAQLRGTIFAFDTWAARFVFAHQQCYLRQKLQLPTLSSYRSSMHRMLGEFLALRFLIHVMIRVEYWMYTNAVTLAVANTETLMYELFFSQNTIYIFYHSQTPSFVLDMHTRNQQWLERTKQAICPNKPPIIKKRRTISTRFECRLF